MSIYEYKMNENVDGLIDYLNNSDRINIRKNAARSLGEIDPNTQKIRDELINTVKNGESLELRIAAVEGLEEMGLDAIEELIIDATGINADGQNWSQKKSFAKALNSNSIPIRFAATIGLGEMQDKMVLKKLLNSINDRSSRVREQIAKSLGKIGHKKAVPKLRKLLKDNDPNVREAAVNALGNIGTKKAYLSIKESLNDSSNSVRRAAVSELSNYPDPNVVENLSEIAKEDEEYIRHSAILSIISILSSVSDNNSEKLRKICVNNLRGEIDKWTVETFADILSMSQQPSHKRNIAWLVGKVITDEEHYDIITDPLLESLSADDQLLRQFSAKSLAEFNSEKIKEELLTILEDESEPLEKRLMAANSLGQTGDKSLRSELKRIAQGANTEEVRKQAFSAISDLGGLE